MKEIEEDTNKWGESLCLWCVLGLLKYMHEVKPCTDSRQSLSKFQWRFLEVKITI